jgi:hypothetical protein
VTLQTTRQRSFPGKPFEAKPPEGDGWQISSTAVKDDRTEFQRQLPYPPYWDGSFALEIVWVRP